jgi:catechol 2,3-dioxygenase
VFLQLIGLRKAWVVARSFLQIENISLGRGRGGTTVSDSIHPKTRIGHVHLKVSDLDRSEAFYREVLGYEVTMRGETVVFMSAGGYHHHLALNSAKSAGKQPPPDDSPGMLHFAILFPEHSDLVIAARRAMGHGVTFHAASDYGYSIAVYMKDPDGNEIELAWDRDRSLWPWDENGNLRRSPTRITVDEALSHQG